MLQTKQNIFNFRDQNLLLVFFCDFLQRYNKYLSFSFLRTFECNLRATFFPGKLYKNLVQFLGIRFYEYEYNCPPF